MPGYSTPDQDRLRQYVEIAKLMKNGRWRTTEEIGERIGLGRDMVRVRLVEMQRLGVVNCEVVQKIGTWQWLGFDADGRPAGLGGEDNAA